MSEQPQAVMAPPVMSATQVANMVPAVPQAEIDKRVSTFLRNLEQVKENSPGFQQQLTNITTLGRSEARSNAMLSSQLISRPAASSSPQDKVAATLLALRQQIVALDPEQANLRPARKFLSWGSNKIDNYFAKYQDAQQHLETISHALTSGADALRRDNAELEMLSRQLLGNMRTLRAYNDMLASLDVQVQQLVERTQQQGNLTRATVLQDQALYSVRQQRMDIQTQLAVATQGYLAMDLIRRNNLELIRGVERAQTTTLTALRVAVVVAEALGTQQRVLDQVSTLNDAMESITKTTAEQVAQLSREDQAEAVRRLQEAFRKAENTLNEVEDFQREARKSLLDATAALSDQLPENQA